MSEVVNLSLAIGKAARCVMRRCTPDNSICEIIDEKYGDKSIAFRTAVLNRCQDIIITRIKDECRGL